MSNSARIIIPRAAFIVVALVLVVVIASLVAFIYLPSATVTVFPATHEKQIEQSIILSSAAQEPDFQRFILPARVIDKEAEEQETIQREGGQARPGFATGAVRLVNEQDEEQPLLPKTNLRHEATGVFFLTDQAVRIPPRGEISVGVTSKEEGRAGNVPAGKFIVDKLPASMQSVVYAESDVAFTGGEVFDIPLSEDELAAAKERVQQQATERARGELTAAAGGAVIRDDLVATEVNEVVASAQPGSQATSYTVRARVRARAFVVDENDLLSLTLLALQAQPAADEEFISYNPESFSAEFVRADFERGEAQVVGRLTGNFARKTGPAVFDETKLAGRTEAEVQEYFKQFEGVGRVEVAFSPFWVSAVPARDGATEIVVKKEQTDQRD